MSRKPFIAGNWKMNKNPEEAKAFVEAVASKLPSSDLVEAGIAAPAVDLTAVLAAAKSAKVPATVGRFVEAGITTTASAGCRVELFNFSTVSVNQNQLTFPIIS